MENSAVKGRKPLRPHIASMLRSPLDRDFFVLQSSPTVQQDYSKVPQMKSYEMEKSPFADDEKLGLHPRQPAPTYATTFGTSLERPKPAIQRGIVANFPKILPHITAATITAAVIQLSYRRHYFMDLMDPSLELLPGITQAGLLNALQLAAKIHELILVASLSTIVMHAAHSYLIGNQGLPLGLLTNTFAIGSGDFLRTRAFWSSIRTKKAHYWRFAMFSLLAAILATLAGPSSAISMIPNLDWFPLVQPFETQPLPLYVFNHSTTLWPTDVTSASLNSPLGSMGGPESVPADEDCLSQSTSDIEYCPAAGFREIYSWAGDLLFVNSSAGTNVSFPDPRQNSRRVLASRSCPTEFDGRASSISLNAFVTSALTAFWTFARNNFRGLGLETAQPRMTFHQPIYAPKVEVLCNGYTFFNDSDTGNRGFVNFPSFTPERVLPREEFELPFSGNFSEIVFQWIPMPPSSDGPAIGAAFQIPHTYRWENETDVIRQGTELHACSLYASWIPVNVYYEPRQSDEITYAVQGSLSDTCLQVPTEPSVGLPTRNLTIDLNFANAINQNIIFVTGEIPVLVAMVDKITFPDEGADGETVYSVRAPQSAAVTGTSFTNLSYDDTRKARGTVLSTMLAGVTTDGLARIAGSGLFPHAAPIFLTNETDADGNAVGTYLVSSAQGGQTESLNGTLQDSENWLRLNPVFERYGYGYNWHGSRTIQFGITVLLIHLCLAMGHVVYIFYVLLVKQEGLVTSWSTVADLVCLAMNSTPSHRLQDTCAGVDKPKTWRQIVAVRETNPSHLEFVVGPEDKSRFPLPEAEKAYGHLPS